MRFDLVKKLSELNLFRDIEKDLSSLTEPHNKLFITPLYGAAKALLVKEFLERENQLIVL